MHFRRRHRPRLALVALAALLASCSTVAVTGRSQFNLIPANEMMSMSATQYSQFLDSNKVSTNVQQTQMVKSVGGHIQKAVESYAAAHPKSIDLANYKWEFNLVESKEVNAWCMPGGKVVVYTGIMPVCRDENGLAVVLGHEISHAIANHGSERMSEQLVAQMGGEALSVALAKKPAQTQALWMQAFGAGAQYGVLLPFSRTQESEADHLGLIFMAMAGYDPNVAVPFWERMAKSSGGQAPPEWMSTHPADETRIAKIKQELPEALTYYKKR